MFYTVIAHDIDNTQRTLIHEAIKKASESWWHQWEDCWVLESGLEFDTLSDRLTPFASIDGSEILILALKETPGGRWAGKLAKGRSDWFAENMTAEGALTSGQTDPWSNPNPVATSANPWNKPASDPWATPTKPTNDPWARPADGAGTDEPPF